MLSAGHPESETLEAVQGRGSGAAGHTGLKPGEKLQLDVSESAHKRCSMEVGNGFLGGES